MKKLDNFTRKITKRQNFFRFISFVRICKNSFLWKAYSIHSSLAQSFLLNINYLTEVRKNFASCANKLVRNILETLLVATRFNFDLMGFLIEVKFEKGLKLVLCYQKLRKFGKIGKYQISNWRNFISFSVTICVLNAPLFQRLGQWMFYS